MENRFHEPSHPAPDEKVFLSYWQAGYEGADHVNNANVCLSMNELTRHILYAREDYQLLEKFGIKTVRESIGWRLVENNGQFDFSVIESRARAANELGLQVNWTFCHYGWPNDLNVFSEAFIDRFAVYCERTMQYLKPFSDLPTIFSPINEISFLSWAVSQNYFSCSGMENPYCSELKHQLIRAALKGCEVIWENDPKARILHCDPLIHVVAPSDQPSLEEIAFMERQTQFEAWDMLCGLKEPQLGGKPHFLDLVGVNYYHSNQWEMGGEPLWWHLEHPLRIPLNKLLLETYERYKRPLLLAETSHVGSGRGAWVKEVAQQALLAQQQNVDLQGICLYPILDRPDWDNLSQWHKSGLWEINLGEDRHKQYERKISEAYAAGLFEAQRLTKNLLHHQYLKKEIGILQGSSMTTIVVFSHLRWDFVYQRPQHLLTRLAEHYPIIFIEEPILSTTENYLEISNPAPGISVLKPYTTSLAPGFADEQLPYIKELITKLTNDLVNKKERHIAWFYTPMALPLLEQLNPSLVIYDCMDELSAFKNSPKQMIEREDALLNVADLVFTGGPSLFRAKFKRHSNVYCFPSSVDVVHFEQALDRKNVHPDHQNIPSPRLGYYGVIDERIDLDLIAYISDHHPEWQIILIGPIVKIDPAILPRRTNIHYLGQHPYKALPQFLAGWDVCLLPFALNESTKYISPTKTLEYMAAALPIVSTSVNDVAELYSDAVAIANTHEDFIKACANALSAPNSRFQKQVRKMKEILLKTSWNDTGEKMFDLIEYFLNKKLLEKAEYSPDFNEIVPTPIHKKEKFEMQKNVVIGAGPTGLSAAYHLDEETILLDKNPTVGGWCRSIQDNGFTFDYAGHIMFSNDPYVQELYKILLNDNVHWQDREAWIFSKGVYTRYPFQGALYGLPPEVIKECLIGAMEAKYGVGTEAGTNSIEQNFLSIELLNEVQDCCADGTISFVCESAAAKNKNKAENFEEFIYRIWGRGIAKHFAIPYNRKLWKVPLTEMETSWLGGRVPLPNLEEMIEGALEPIPKPMGPNARFGYPLQGGFQSLMNGFLPGIKGELALNTAVVSISPSSHSLTLSNGQLIHYKNVISTMPLPELIRCIGSEAPEEIKNAARGLRYVSVRCVNLGVGRENITDKHWIYFPEETIFHRIFVQGNASLYNNPSGGFGLTCEITYSNTFPLAHEGQELIDRCVEDCISVGLLTPNDKIIASNLVDMPYAYVVYDHERAANVKLIREWLLEKNIILSGRYSEWEYYNSDHAFIAGKKAADLIKVDTKKKNSYGN